MSKFKKGNKVVRTIGDHHGMVKGDIAVVEWQDGDRHLHLVGHDVSFLPSAYKLVKKIKEEEDVWSFDVSSDKLIDYYEIEKTLTREHPMAIVHRGDGCCMVILHDSVYAKALLMKKEHLNMLDTAMEPFTTWNKWPLLTDGYISAVTYAVKSVRKGRVKKSNRNPVTCEVHMVKI